MALLLFLHFGKRSELISRMFFKPYGTEREILSCPCPLVGKRNWIPL